MDLNDELYPQMWNDLERDWAALYADQESVDDEP